MLKPPTRYHGEKKHGISTTPEMVVFTEMVVFGGLQAHPG
jgi:hypothetical protein